MRIAVLNFAPNVGKSVLARHLLLPRVPGAELLQIDPYRPLNGESMWDFVCAVLGAKNIVVDVPYGHTRGLFVSFEKYAGLHKRYDYFVIPTTAESDVTVRKTVATIVRLSDIGVPPQKIRLIFNSVDCKTNMSRSFSVLYRYWKEERTFELNAAAVIHHNNLFRQFYGAELTFAQLMETPDDLLLQAVATEAVDDNYLRRKLIAAKRMAPVVMAELDAAFQAILG